MPVNATDCDFTGNEVLVLTSIEFCICCLVACEGMLTVVTILRTPSLHENQYLFIVSLALMDMLLAVAGIVVTCIYLPPIRVNLHGSILIALSIGASNASISMTGVNMSIIAMDRYIRIAHPFYYINKMTKQRILKILVCAWNLWMLITFIPVMRSRATNVWNGSYKHEPPEIFLTHLSVVLASVGVVFVCYFKIARLAIHHKKAAIARRHQNGENTDGSPRSKNTIILKSIKFFMTTFGVYFIGAIIPFASSATQFLYEFSYLISFLSWYLIPVHSVMNFFIFCTMDKRFLRALNTPTTLRT